jgi:hypothetical protein
MPTETPLTIAQAWAGCRSLSASSDAAAGRRALLAHALASRARLIAEGRQPLVPERWRIPPAGRPTRRARAVPSSGTGSSTVHLLVDRRAGAAPRDRAASSWRWRLLANVRTFKRSNVQRFRIVDVGIGSGYRDRAGGSPARRRSSRSTSRPLRCRSRGATSSATASRIAWLAEGDLLAPLGERSTCWSATRRTRSYEIDGVWRHEPGGARRRPRAGGLPPAARAGAAKLRRAALLLETARPRGGRGGSGAPEPPKGADRVHQDPAGPTGL